MKITPNNFGIELIGTDAEAARFMNIFLAAMRETHGGDVLLNNYKAGEVTPNNLPRGWPAGELLKAEPTTDCGFLGSVWYKSGCYDLFLMGTGEQNDQVRERVQESFK